MYLRQGDIEVWQEFHTATVYWPEDVTRVIALTYDRDGEMVDLKDHWPDMQYIDDEQEVALTETDVRMVIMIKRIHETADSYPVIRTRLKQKSKPELLYKRIPGPDLPEEPDDELRGGEPQRPHRPRRRAEGNGEEPQEANEDMVVDHNAPKEMRDDFGEKPPMVTKTQWTALKKLHIKLAHPATTSLQRMLRRAGARPEVIAAVPHSDCAVCKELVRPTSERAESRHQGQRGSGLQHRRVHGRPGARADRWLEADVQGDDRSANSPGSAHSHELIEDRWR